MFPANQVIYKEPLKHHPRIQTRPQGLVLDFFKREDWIGPWGQGCERHTNRVSRSQVKKNEMFSRSFS